MRSAFFNSMNGDRKYRAENWAEYFSQFIGNGVYINPATCMQVREAGGMRVQIKAGSCFINGYAGYADGTDVLTLDHGGIMPRMDRIVIRLDFAARNIYPAVITGTAADSPSPPAIVRDGSIYDLGIASITVPANATAVTQASITDTRPNSAVCGFVSGVVDQVDVTDLFAQFDAAWNDFIKSLLAEDDRIYINTADEQARKDILAMKLRSKTSDILRVF